MHAYAASKCYVIITQSSVMLVLKLDFTMAMTMMMIIAMNKSEYKAKVLYGWL